MATAGAMLADGMSAKDLDLGEGTRFPLRVLTKRLQEKLRQLDIKIAALATYLGFKEPGPVYKKFRLDQSSFSIAEFARAADWIEERFPGEAPPGWPFLDEEAAREQLRKMLDRLVSKGARP